jgi:hypothetical protein
MSNLNSALSAAIDTATKNVELHEEKLNIVREFCHIQIAEAVENLEKARLTLQAIKKIETLIEPIPDFPPPSYQDIMANNNPVSVAGTDIVETVAETTPASSSTSEPHYLVRDRVETIRDSFEAMRIYRETGIYRDPSFDF